MKLGILFASAAGTFAAAFLFWWASLGGYEKAEYWLDRVYDVKVYRANQIHKPKLIIAGGSSSLFGIDSSLLTDSLGVDVINMAGHASLSLAFHSDVIKTVVRAGDVVVLPLEYAYYEQSAESITDWQLANMQSWGHQHVRNGELADIVSFFRHTSLLKAAHRIANPLPPQDAVDDAIEVNEGSRGVNFPRWQSYNYSSLTFRGDFLPTLPPTQSLMGEFDKGIPYLKSAEVHPTVLKRLNKLHLELKRSGARLYITWPPTIKNSMFDLDDPHVRARAEALRTRITDSGLAFICDPTESNFNVDRFFDTSYHLNARGAVLRTTLLSDCLLNEVFDGRQKTVGRSPEEVARLRADEVYRKKLNAPNPHVAIRLADLAKLKAALTDYFNEHGNYPASEKWDGLYSPWGRSSDDWITGLAPKHIPALPRDPRRNRDGQEQYLYRSNGTDYKLIAHGNASDCSQLRRQAASLLDPVRGCSAYGYWSPGAESW
ncbi:hypothetical protein WG922_17635 [Ramlibacter sp. AN1015]|uniref:hypothetical protein n=1 Tax=Ramlibacter sp. AN1015 TaxID=3133428 RepID=UPI0030C08D24